MTTKRFLISSIFILILINIIALASLWLQNKGAIHPPRHQIDNLLRDELEWNQAQIEQFHIERRALKQRTQPIVHELHQAKKTLFEMALDETNEAKELESQTLAIAQLHAQLEAITVQHIMSLNAICEPQQRPKLRAFLGELLQMGRPGGGDKRVGPPPPPRQREH